MSSSLDNRLGRVFRSFGGDGIYPILVGVLALLLLIQAVRLVWAIVTPLGPVGDWKTNQVQVLPPQSRMALFSSFDPFFRGGQQATGNVVTSLQLTLFGIRMNEGSGLGSAILAGPDGVQDSFAVGDEIMSGVTLDGVRFDHVIIDRNSVKESLYIDQSVPAETVTPVVPVIETVDPLSRAGETVAPAEETEKPITEPAEKPESDEAS